jgi:hypothetical protein
MSRGQQSSKQGDLTKVAKAMAKTMVRTGVKDWRMEIEQGKIVVIASELDAGASSDGQTSADLRKLL